MRKLMWALAAIVMLFGCKPKIPKDIIVPDKMQKILYDIHVADGYISTILLPDSSKKVAAAYYNGIYKKFGIDSAQYTKSMDYYYAHPKDLDKIYKNISKTLESQKKKLEKADSLQKVKIEKVKADKEKLKKTKDSLKNIPAKLKQAPAGLKQAPTIK